MQPDEISELCAALLRMLPAGARSSAGSISGSSADLPTAELAATGRMSERRLKDFTAGRAQARIVLRELGLESPVVPVGPGRTPLWPAGFVGSISHAGDVAVAVGAPDSLLAAIGVDLEPAVPLATELLERVCLPAELARLRSHPRPGVGATLTFSAKESVYKCLSPLTGAFLEFEEVEIELDMAGGRFVARGHGPNGSLVSDALLVGRFAGVGGYWLTSAWQWATACAETMADQRPGGL
jgi:4'-phosphopantetheinyl transferase EntD